MKYPTDNRRSMDRFRREAGWETEEHADPKPQEIPAGEKNPAVDTKLLIAFWSCCQLER